MKTDKLAHQAIADQLRKAGARATPARIRVLALLRSTPTALSHHELDAALGQPALDRVTLYRVLDWLSENGMVQKSIDAQRVSRFSAVTTGEHTAHAHFRCEQCGRVFCLDAAPPAPPALPAGFALSRAEFDLRGCCATCSTAQI